MKESYWGYWLMVLGVFIIVVLLLIQSFTSTNTQDYYLIKEITESSLVDAIDYGYYREYGELKINKEKFYEVFLRRFAEEASLTTTYTIEFTEIYEAPPKVGVKVSSKSSTFTVGGDTTTFDIVNKLDAILESKNSANIGEGEGSTVDDFTGDGEIINPSTGEEEAPEGRFHVQIGNPASIVQQSEYVTVNGVNVNMGCACGPIAITEAAIILGKTNTLKSGVNYSGSNNKELAAATYIKMHDYGLNGDPTTSNYDSSSPSFCGRTGNYSSGNGFYSTIGISVAGSGGSFGSKSGGYADEIFKQLASGNVVIASLPPNTSNVPSDSGLKNTNSGHYYTIYGYDANNGCFKVYNPMAGNSCVSDANVDKYFTEYISYSG